MIDFNYKIDFSDIQNQTYISDDVFKNLNYILEILNYKDYNDIVLAYYNRFKDLDNQYKNYNTYYIILAILFYILSKNDNNNLTKEKFNKFSTIISKEFKRSIENINIQLLSDYLLVKKTLENKN